MTQHNNEQIMRQPLFTMAEISLGQFETSQNAGKLWTAIDGKVYDVSSWCKLHPGGKLVLLHSAGRDASEAFHAYHPKWVQKLLPSYQIGQLSSLPHHPGSNFTTETTTGIIANATTDTPTQQPCTIPSVSQHMLPSAQQASTLSPPKTTSACCNLPCSTADFSQSTSPSQRQQHAERSMQSRLKAVQLALELDGLFQTSVLFYVKLAVWCCTCLAAAIWCVMHQYIVTGALLLGLFWQQVHFCLPFMRFYSTIDASA